MPNIEWINLAPKNYVTADKTASRKIITRMVIGGAIGFVLGFLMGMLVSPPFSGITSTSFAVQDEIAGNLLV